MSAEHAHHRHERRAGLLLIAAAAAALLLANGPWSALFHDLLGMQVGPPMPRLGRMSVHEWVADGAMALFFLLVGLEVKREWLAGHLALPSQRLLPIIAAMAGMAVPALVYVAVTGASPALHRGWAIPAATDIAFAIGVLAILGRHAPPAVKLLLVTIAIIDDIGAVLIIAVAYSDTLDPRALLAAIAVLAVMAAMARLGVARLAPFMIGFVLLWLTVLASGIHPTIAGVAAAMTVPLGESEAQSPLRRLEHRLHPWVMFAIVPLFGLVSAGVSLDGGLPALGDPLPLAILLGLVLGKQFGVFAAIFLLVRSGLALMPAGVGWRHLWGAAALCGIGFTMSLFIAPLAFPTQPALVEAAKLGTLAGSLLSAIAGFMILRSAAATPAAAPLDADADAIFCADSHA